MQEYLSGLLSNRELSWDMIALGLIVAFGLGAAHALSPGHGKAIVAAYLVGSRGTPIHAILLGATVTFTHTITVFALGIGVLFFQQYVSPERIIPILGALSGMSIFLVGGWLLYRRVQALALADAHGLMHTHSHGGVEHSHANLGSLIALGVSGGLVPCPSALILMLSAVGIGRPAFGLAMLVMFSAGLAIVLMGIGLLVIYAKHLLPQDGLIERYPFLRLLPVFSAVIVMMLGALMTMTSLGWISLLT